MQLWNVIQRGIVFLIWNKFVLVNRKESKQSIVSSWREMFDETASGEGHSSNVLWYSAGDNAHSTFLSAILWGCSLTYLPVMNAWYPIVASEISVSVALNRNAMRVKQTDYILGHPRIRSLVLDCSFMYLKVVVKFYFYDADNHTLERSWAQQETFAAFSKEISLCTCKIQSDWVRLISYEVKNN